MTRLGMVDVPPRVCGTYGELVDGAREVDIGGIAVLVCDPQEVLDRLEGRQRVKDRDRAAQYEWLRRQRPADREPVGVDRLLAATS